MSERILVQFDRAQWHADARSATVWLRGEEQGTGGQCAQVFFSGAASAVPAAPPPQPPSPLQALQVCERLDGQGRRSWQVRSPQGAADIAARDVQVHREPARAFYRVLPSPAVPRRVRLGWNVLLALLRVPGAASLIARVRSR